MPSSFANKHLTKDLLRLILRLLVGLYHASLGWLFGSQFLLPTTISRKTGLPHQAVLEVVFHDKTTDTYYIAAGWGNKLDWVRNLHKTPRVSVIVGFKRFTATASEIPPGDAEQVFFTYTQQHLFASSFLSRLFVDERLQSAAGQSHTMTHMFPLVGAKPVG